MRQMGIGPVVQMTDVVLGRIFGPSLRQQGQHPGFDGAGVGVLFQNVVLMEDMAEEVSIVELSVDLRLEIRRESLEPIRVVATKRNIEWQ